MLGHGQLLLLAVIELLLKNLRMHLTLLLQLLHAILGIDHILQFNLHLLVSLFELSGGADALRQLLLCHRQFLPLHIPLVVDGTNFNIVVLNLVTQIEELRLCILQLTIQPQSRSVVAIVGAW